MELSYKNVPSREPELRALVGSSLAGLAQAWERVRAVDADVVADGDSGSLSSDMTPRSAPPPDTHQLRITPTKSQLPPYYTGCDNGSVTRIRVRVGSVADTMNGRVWVDVSRVSFRVSVRAGVCVSVGVYYGWSGTRVELLRFYRHYVISLRLSLSRAEVLSSREIQPLVRRTGGRCEGKRLAKAAMATRDAGHERRNVGSK